MKEEEWLAKTDSIPEMFALISGRHSLSDRKTLLVGCAFCRQLPEMTVNATKALEWVERQAERESSGDYDFVDELIDDTNEGFVDGIWPGVIAVEELISVYGGGRSWNRTTSLWDGIAAVAERVLRETQPYYHDPQVAAKNAARDVARIAQARAHQHELIRDIFGNPFRPVTLDPRWLSMTVLDLARTIYDQRTFENMPILADALMDAGCDSEEIIQHCHSPGPHVRGCWVVDLLLGKE